MIRAWYRQSAVGLAKRTVIARVQLGMDHCPLYGVAGCPHSGVSNVYGQKIGTFPNCPLYRVSVSYWRELKLADSSIFAEPQSRGAE